MQEYKEIESSEKFRKLSTAIVILGIAFRFYHQFIYWTFNRDEVLLGRDILNHNFPDLIKPFESFQSAPPLFLIFQNIISNIEPHYISLKVLSFISSCLSIVFFKKIIEKDRISIITICLLAIFSFNPFILYHSLTLKQYTFDLTLSLFAVYFFSNQKSFGKTYIIFTLWCLFSNVGLFFSAAFAANIFIENLDTLRKSNFLDFFLSKLKKALPFILAPVMYILFFIWFTEQPGAKEAEEYMKNYWVAWFVPLNTNVFWWIGVQFYRIMFFFYSTYFVLGIMLLSGCVFSFYSFIRKTGKRKNIFFIRIYSIAICIHLTLSTLQLYPFSDRLYLYIAPFVLYLSINGLVQFLNYWRIGKDYIQLFILFFTLILLGFNMTYINYKENNIPSLNEKLRIYSDHTVYRTSRADKHINQWVDFTNYPYLSKALISSANRTDLNSLKADDLIISRVYKKFGNEYRTNKIEESLQHLLTQNKMKKVIEVDGYNVYLVN